MMKKFLFVLLALMLLLTACGNQAPQETSAPTTEPTEPPGIYVENSDIEQQTQGAVRVYDPEGTYTALSAIGDQLLLLSEGEKTSLQLLTGDRRVVTATAQLNFDITDTVYQTTYAGLVYYDRQNREAVFLNTQLQESERVKMPEEMEGYPAFSPNGNEIFYCAGQEIRILDVEQGFTRMLKSHACKSQMLLGCAFEGKMLVCSVENEAGEHNTVYISAQTGQTLRTDNDLRQLATYEDSYFVTRTDGGVPQRLFGTMDQQPGQQLNMLEGTAVSALELGGIVCYSQNAETGLQLDFYDIATGMKTSSVNLPVSQTPADFLADRWTGSLWILTQAAGNQQLLCWNVKKTPVEDAQVYTSAAYTAETPDEAGLALCQEKAKELKDKHGVDIRIWQDAVKYDGGYNLVAEYQPMAIQNCMDQLDAFMSLFPEDFLYKSVNNRIRICIVRSVSDKTDVVLYWYDGDPFILIPATADVHNAFMKELSAVVDIHVLGNSPMYDYWNDLNPEGFVYGDEATYKEEYLEGENIAFFSEASMKSAPEDRSQIFVEAMKADNAQAFKGEIMQRKLLLICQAIRDAWRWEKKTDVYPWEQYLTESIAYQK